MVAVPGPAREPLTVNDPSPAKVAVVGMAIVPSMTTTGEPVNVTDGPNVPVPNRTVPGPVTCAAPDKVARSRLRVPAGTLMVPALLRGTPTLAVEPAVVPPVRVAPASLMT